MSLLNPRWLGVAVLLGGAALAAESSTNLASWIERGLPRAWMIVEKNPAALPQGHYWGQDYDGVRGEEIVLQGSEDVKVSWQDATGNWHTEAIGKEALRLYVMPKDYRESMLRFLILKRPPTAALLIETESAKVYAQPSFRVVEKDRLDRIVKQAQAVSWPANPARTGLLTWEAWRSDLVRHLKNGS